MELRENWRVLLLAVFVVASTVALFAPTGVAGSANDSAVNTDSTNLQYGLDLSGGARVRAPLVGLTAENVPVTGETENQVISTVVAELPIGRSDIQVRFRTPDRADVEVFSRNVTAEEFAGALQSAGVDVQEGAIRDGVTEETRQTAVRVINRKINLGGLSGGSAQIVRQPTEGEQAYILVEVPNENRSAVIELLSERGNVELVAAYPAERNNETVSVRQSVLSREDFATISPATDDPQRCGGAPACVPVTLTDPAATRFTTVMMDTGFTSPRGTGNCQYDANPENPGYCLLTVTDGEVVYDSSMGDGLARELESGDFEKDPSFIVTSNNLTEAQQLALDLRAGALPTTLAIDEGTQSQITTSEGERRKTLSLVIGLVAVLAVSVTVFIRYGRPEVAAPMLVTALAEVYLLLGFAAAVGLALDLSHIAGFIAVVGTGVDDLIIIADEIMQRGEIKTTRVFQSRFRKAFWVIGAAAATTIIAMSPLAVLSLGDLQGFAIVTIVGVLLGVLVSRPAYGDVLRNLVIRD